MALEIKVPSVGESVTEVRVASWNKKEGDFVNRDEILCELESDKATFELPAEASGTLHLIAKVGDTLPIGALLCSIETSGQNGNSPASTPQKSVSENQSTNLTPVDTPAPVAAPAASAVVDVKVPSVGESVTEVTIASWNKKDGD